MHTSAKVSVLVPTYNGGAFLDEALRGIAEQSYPDLEVLVRDDGSTDDTAEIVAGYQRIDSRFVWLQDGRRLGSTGNMVELLKQASGDYIKFCNQDDVLEPRCIEKLIAPMQHDSSLVLSTSVRQLIDEDGNQLAPTPYTQPLTPQDQAIPGRLLANHVLTRSINQIGEPSTVLFRSGLFDPEDTFVLNGVTFEVNNDIALWVKLLLRGDAYFTTETLSKFRLHSGQRSADVHEAITGTLEWPHLIRIAVANGIVSDATDLQHMCRNAIGGLSWVNRLATHIPEQQRDAAVARIASGLAQMEQILDEYSITLGDAPMSNTTLDLYVRVPADPAGAVADTDAAAAVPAPAAEPQAGEQIDVAERIADALTSLVARTGELERGMSAMISELIQQRERAAAVEASQRQLITALAQQVAERPVAERPAAPGGGAPAGPIRVLDNHTFEGASRSDSMRRLHLGCGPNRIVGWLNVDGDAACAPDAVLDLRRRFDFDDSSVDYIYSEHFFEHVSLPEAMFMFGECARVLRPGGVIRTAMPNLADTVHHYLGDWRDQQWLRDFPQVDSPAHMLNLALREWGHRYVYDHQELSLRLRQAGFVEITPRALGESEHPALRGLETRPESTLIVEATVAG